MLTNVAGEAMLRKPLKVSAGPCTTTSVPTALMIQLRKPGIFSIRICYSDFVKSLRYTLILSAAGETPSVHVRSLMIPLGMGILFH